MTATDRPRTSIDVSAIPARPAGAGRYVVDLVRALHASGGVDLTLVARRGDGARWAGLAPSARVVAVAPEPRPLRLAWEQAGLPGALAKLGLDCHHGPHYTMPERARLPVVVSIMDLTFFDHPERHERTKVPLFRRAIRVAAAHADALVCISDRTAHRLVELLDPAAPVVVAPLGVDLDRFRPEEPSPGADRSVLDALGVRSPYVLFLGTLEPRKRVPALVRAFDRVAAGHADLELVLAGGRGWGADEVDAAIAAARHGDRVRALGYVDDDAVPALLRGAAAVAYPSVDEGFGLPALEALACGAPLVTTEGTPMADVARAASGTDGGEVAALLVPADDEAALTEALADAVAGAAAGQRRREAGLAAAAQHTWQRTAEIHERVYRAVAGLPGDGGVLASAGGSPRGHR